MDSPAPDDQDAAAGSTAPTVVGIGASAGGVNAVRDLLEALPPSDQLCLVIIQHQTGRQESMLAEVLGHVSQMPVREAEEGVPLAGGHVWVIPPGKLMVITDGRLHLGAVGSGGTHMAYPVDRFLESLAKHAGRQAIAVILSGMATDGVQGTREIKAAGGITFAQDPQTAQFDSMPRAAIEAGIVDKVLSPVDIATTLADIAQHPYLNGIRRPETSEAAGRDVKHGRLEAAKRTARGAGATGTGERFEEPPLGLEMPEESLHRLFELLRTRVGVDFSEYKRPTVRRRLARRMAVHRITDVEAYLGLLEEQSEELDELHRDLLIHVTRFFRDPPVFEALASRVFPELEQRAAGGHGVRIWVPGCATGEEPYSLAMAIMESLGEEKAAASTQIFATDLSEVAIARARMGIFPAAIADDVSEERLRRFFTRVDGGYRVRQQVRDMCVFARQDVTRDPPFSRLDLLVCRNVLIYLDVGLQERLVQVFHYALRDGGYLLLGTSETPGHRSEYFGVVDKKHRIYRRKPGDAHPQLSFSAVTARTDRTAPNAAPSRPQHRNKVLDLDRLLVERYAPPSLLVDETFNILQARGDTTPYLRLPSGDATLHLMHMAHHSLSAPLRSVIDRARALGEPARQEAVVLGAGNDAREVDVEVVPVGVPPDGPRFLVLFDEHAARIRRRGQIEAPATPARDGEARGGPTEVNHLRQELAATREHMQAMIQDLEATNEELQAANEEILSSNEELQSTNEELDTAKEELQSANEELNTVNDELHSRNEELSRVNSDLRNLFGSVDIAIVMVDDTLCIRRFTPVAERVLNLIGSDIGRPIGHIRPNLDIEDLGTLTRHVIDAVEPASREARDQHGRWYSLRIRPYKSMDNRIEGAVLTLVDIDAIKRHQHVLDEAEKHAAAVLDALRQPLVVVDEDLRVRHVNRAFDSTFGISGDEATGVALRELAGGAFAFDSLQKRLVEVRDRDESIAPLPVEGEFPQIGRRKCIVDVRRVARSRTKTMSILLMIEPAEPTDGS